MTGVRSSTEDKIEETAQRSDADNCIERHEVRQPFTQGDTTRQRFCNYKSVCLIGISTICLAAFLYATIVQYNDPDGMKWSIFYGLQAAIPLLFLVHFFTRIGTTGVVICAVSFGVIIWSIIMIVLVSTELKNLSENDEYYVEQREELVFELSGVLLGTGSALYHIIITHFCVR
jgi:hypothetical protein